MMFLQPVPLDSAEFHRCPFYRPEARVPQTQWSNRNVELGVDCKDQNKRAQQRATERLAANEQRVRSLRRKAEQTTTIALERSSFGYVSILPKVQTESEVFVLYQEASWFIGVQDTSCFLFQG